MFTKDDFFNIFNYLKDGTTPENLEVVTRYLSESERTVASDFFTNKLDLNIFATDDYKKLREFLIDWYASHRTLITTQKKVNDPYSLPKTHLDEILRSFGFDVSLNDITRMNEANLVLDIVNLYKMKGTPKGLARALSYFNLNRLDVMEYWIKLSSSGEPVFQPEICVQNNSLGITLPGVPLNFNLVEDYDPHWMLSKNDLMALFNNDDICFPVKTSYIGVRPLYFIDSELILVTSILSKKIYDEYISYLGGNVLPQDEVKITIVNNYFSVLELVLVCDYAINCYGVDTHIPVFSNFYSYNGSYSIYNEVEKVIDEYAEFIKRPFSRLERKERIEQFYNTFTVNPSQSFIPNYTDAKTLLNTINPSLRSKIDELIATGKKKDVLFKSMKDLSEWISYNVGPNYSNFATFGLGADSIDFLNEIVEFFKPYRARLLTLDSGFIMKSPLLDSCIVEDLDNFTIAIDQTIVDFDTADSLPGYIDDEFNEFAFILSNPQNLDQREIEDMYVDQFGNVQCVYKDTSTPVPGLNFITSTPPVGCFRITNIFLRIEDYYPQQLPMLVIEYNDSPEVAVSVGTRIPSLPNWGYMIENMFMTEISNYHGGIRGVKVVYDPSFYTDVDFQKRYYSRTHYDQGSFFDIGSVMDGDMGKWTDINNPHIVQQDLRINIEDTIHEKVNNQPPGKSYSHTEWDTVGPNISEIRCCGGMASYDEGAFYDERFVKDSCKIIVTDF